MRSTLVRRLSARLGALAIGLGLLIGAAPAQAAASWIFRGLTLPRGGVALDLGLGVGHEPTGDNNRSITGTGMNLEIAIGISHELELGLRTGARFGTDGELTQADRYGRTFDTEYYGTRFDALANPELRLRWAVAQGSVLKLGLEVRAYLPTESGSRIGFMFGLPLRLRLGPARIDTGIYVPVIFYDPTQTAVSFPLHIWLQASRGLWLGPLLGVRLVNNDSQYPLGFGLGAALSGAIDLRTWILFPDISRDAAARHFGAGVGLQIRFE